MINIWFVIPIAGFTLALLVFLHTLIVKRKEATIEGQDKDITRLKLLLDEANNASPDILAERYKRKIDRYESELKELMRESEVNSLAIRETEKALQSERANVAELSEQMKKANEILDEYEYLKEQFSCPHCGAETTTLADDGYGSVYTAYACGHSFSGSDERSPCPHDPEFPSLDEYEFELRQHGDSWFCAPKPVTKNANKLTLHGSWAKTQEEARTSVVGQYNARAPKNKQLAI